MVAATLGEPVTKTRGNCKAVRGRLDMAALPPVFTPEERKQGSEFDRLRDNPAYCVLDSEDTVVVAGCQVQARFLDAPLWAMASAGGE